MGIDVHTMWELCSSPSDGNSDSTRRHSRQDEHDGLCWQLIETIESKNRGWVTSYMKVFAVPSAGSYEPPPRFAKRNHVWTKLQRDFQWRKRTKSFSNTDIGGYTGMSL
jgi:hypothetical protein